LQIERERFYDIVQTCPSAGLIIFQYLIKSECQELKGTKSKTIQLDEKNEKVRNFSNSDEFIEIDVEKKIGNLKENPEIKEIITNENLKICCNYAPLYIHEIFAMEQRKIQAQKEKDVFNESPIKTKKKHSYYSSSFLNEKMEKQILEENKLKFDKKANKSLKKSSSNQMTYSGSKMNISYVSNMNQNNVIKKKNTHIHKIIKLLFFFNEKNSSHNLKN
jgi:hypothetical protein